MRKLAIQVDLDQIVSSETKRKTTLNFIEYISINSDQPNAFFEWFVGFSEASAQWQKQKNTLRFRIDKADPQPLDYLQQQLGFGSVTQYEYSGQRGSYYRYVASGENAKKLKILFKGNLLLKKSNDKFASWQEEGELLCRGQQGGKEHFLHLNPPQGSAWLSGYIDARGAFAA